MRHLVFRLTCAAVLAVLAFLAISFKLTPRIIIAIVIGLPSFVLMILSRRQLGKSFSVMPEAKALVTTGLYSKIQHPMYLTLDLFLLAIIILIGWPILLIIWGLIIVMQTIQAQREEKVLEAAFGNNYKEYLDRIWC